MSDIDNVDDYIIHVEIVDAVGDGGTFYGDHVVTGDPLAPPPDWENGQLLFDGYDEDPTDGTGGGGGPHDHDEYALAEHDHDEYALAEHDHDDYLPLSGGTLTGELHLSGGSPDTPAYIRVNSDPGRKVLALESQEDRTGSAFLALHGEGDFSGKAVMYGGGFRNQEWYDGSTRIYGDLTVDGSVTGDLTVNGNTDVIINAPADAWGLVRGTVYVDQGLTSGTQGAFGTAMTCNGYRNISDKWVSLGLNDLGGATTIELLPEGKFNVRVASNWPTGSGHTPPARFTVTEAGPTFRAMPSQTRSVDDVLDRAETAEFPPADDDGVATMDGHDEVPLFEVVTALLAKVKELSARIEELEGN